MAITIQNTPGTRYSAHGDLIFVVCDIVKASDPVTYTDYKYVADVYIGSELVARLKAVPRPDNKMGIFNIGNIIRNYVSCYFDPTANQLRAMQIGSSYFFIEATVKFGEEYGTTLTTNITVDSARVYFNHYNGRLIGQNTTLSDKLDKAMTDRPTATPVYRSDSFCFFPFLPSDADNITLQIKTYNSAGLQATQNSSATTPIAANWQQLFNVAPQNLNALYPGLINDAIDYYTVEFQTPNISDDSLYRFNLVCEPRYEVFTVHFINRYGGFESRNFTKVSRKTIDIEKNDFGNLPFTLDVCGVVSYKTSNNVYNETRSTYSSQYKEKLVLNTDILTDAEYLWLSDLILSPMVYIEMESHFIPCVISSNNYEFRKAINDKLTNLTINIEFGEQFNTQFR